MNRDKKIDDLSNVFAMQSAPSSTSVKPKPGAKEAQSLTLEACLREPKPGSILEDEFVLRIVEVRRAKPPKKMVFIKLANDQGFTLELASYAEKHTTMLQKALAGADRLESLEGLVIGVKYCEVGKKNPKFTKTDADYLLVMANHSKVRLIRKEGLNDPEQPVDFFKDVKHGDRRLGGEFHVIRKPIHPYTFNQKSGTYFRVGDDDYCWASAFVETDNPKFAESVKIGERLKFSEGLAKYREDTLWITFGTLKCFRKTEDASPISVDDENYRAPRDPEPIVQQLGGLLDKSDWD